MPGACAARSASASRVLAAEWPAPTTRVARPAKRSRSAPRTSGSADSTKAAASDSPCAGMPAAPRTIRRTPGARGVDDRAGQDLLAGVQPYEERGGLAAGGADPVEAGPGHGGDPCAVAQVRFELRQVGQRLEVVGDELGAGGEFVVVGAGPAGFGEQAGGGRVDVEPPRGEEPDVPPLPDGRRGPVAGLEDGEGDPALAQVGGGGEADRARADHDHRQGGVHLGDRRSGSIPDHISTP